MSSQNLPARPQPCHIFPGLRGSLNCSGRIHNSVGLASFRFKKPKYKMAGTAESNGQVVMDPCPLGPQLQQLLYAEAGGRLTQVFAFQKQEIPWALSFHTLEVSSVGSCPPGLCSAAAVQNKRLLSNGVNLGRSSSTGAATLSCPVLLPSLSYTSLICTFLAYGPLSLPTHEGFFSANVLLL